MPIYKTADIIGWQNKKGEFYCSECFDKEFSNNDSVEGWSPVLENEGDENTYLCDCCNHRV